MVIGKRNEFLDLPDSEDEGHVSGHESDELTKGRETKRRRLNRADDDDTSSDDGEEDAQVSSSQYGSGDSDHADVNDVNEKDEERDASGHSTTTATKPKLKLHVATPLAHKNVITTDEAVKKSGVIYLSRIPPFLKPSKLRSLLAPYGSLNRIFLSPEDPLSHARRVRAGGNKKRSFTEGWVEFVRKKDAKRTVELLNTRPIGGRKGSYYRDDIWSMIYLHGFKWRYGGLFSFAFYALEIFNTC